MTKFSFSRLLNSTFLITLLLFTSHVTFLYSGDSDFETSGTIESIGADSLVVNNYHFTVDAQTEIKDKNTGNINFTDLRKNDFVKVRGQLIAGGKYYAEKIERENDKIEVEGAITSVGMDYIDVNGSRFFVTGATRVKSKYGIRISFSDLLVGLNVEIEGFLSDSIYIASEIKLQERHFEHHLEISGKIDTVVSDGIIINQNLFIVTNKTIIRLHHDQLGNLNDLSPGMFVEVKAAWLADGSLFAIRINTEDHFEDEIEIVGKIDSIGTDFLNVLNYHITIDSLTQNLNYDGYNNLSPKYSTFPTKKEKVNPILGNAMT